MSSKDLFPQFPLYIPSKGRSELMITSKALTAMGVRHTLIVEEAELAAYERAVKRDQLLVDLLVLDPAYQREYEALDKYGLERPIGAGPARNFAWDHAVSGGHEWHWVMDDNIYSFRRLQNTRRYKVKTASFWRVMEDFVLRYRNVALAGPNYSSFAPGSRSLWFPKGQPPFYINSRIYSCNFIRNSLPFRWRGRYNEDTILSLDALTSGWCTILFNAFLQEKAPTQTVPGGNTEDFYKGGGDQVKGKTRQQKSGKKYAEDSTREKTVFLQNIYPEYTKIVYKFGRIHHNVNYMPFKNRKLILRDDIEIPTGKNEYGMRLKPTEKKND